MTDTGLNLDTPPIDFNAAIAKAVAETVPEGHTWALVGFANTNRDFHVAFARKMSEGWTFETTLDHKDGQPLTGSVGIVISG